MVVFFLLITTRLTIFLTGEGEALIRGIREVELGSIVCYLMKSSPPVTPASEKEG
jgi:hypothetical protein